MYPTQSFTAIIKPILPSRLCTTFAQLIVGRSTGEHVDNAGLQQAVTDVCERALEALSRVDANSLGTGFSHEEEEQRNVQAMPWIIAGSMRCMAGRYMDAYHSILSSPFDAEWYVWYTTDAVLAIVLTLCESVWH